ncbi:hypothetical protein [Actinobacillus capsulatus]|uniref:hypothetical protein n=1 Tax=Actinobacillus capsulatus TaxID=717 RepID=UPI0003799982|nr:hypothetical protein [Actinobacillus capsulatus]
MENLIYTKFEKINLNVPFFNSLKKDYKEFSDWFNKKKDNNEGTFIFLNSQKLLDSFT